EAKRDRGAAAQDAPRQRIKKSEIDPLQRSQQKRQRPPRQDTVQPIERQVGQRVEVGLDVCCENIAVLPALPEAIGVVVVVVAQIPGRALVEQRRGHAEGEHPGYRDEPTCWELFERQGGDYSTEAPRAAPVEALYPHFGITAEKVAEAARSLP